MPAKRSHKRPSTDIHIKDASNVNIPMEEPRKIVVKSHIRSVRPKIVKTPSEAINDKPIDKHIEKPTIKRQRKPIQSAISINESIKEIAKRSTKQAVVQSIDHSEQPEGSSEKKINKDHSITPELPESAERSIKETPFPIHSISKLVLSAMIWMLNGKGNLSMEFKLGNLTFTVDEILHHSSGIIDGVDKRLYSKYKHINKPHGIYSNEAFNFLAKNLKSVIGTTYKRALNEFNSRLGTHFTSNDIAEEIGAYDLLGTTDDLNKLGELVRLEYDWFANGTVKRPGRGVDIITPSGISKLGSFKERCEDVKITISRKKVTVERGNLEWADKKYIVQQKIPKTKFMLDFDNRRVTVPIMSQPLNLPFESVDKPEELVEINGEYWKLIKTAGKIKYYQSPITNSRKPFLVVTDQ
jgi:hypothetical protein